MMDVRQRVEVDQSYRQKIYFHTDKKTAINESEMSSYCGEYMTYILQALQNEELSNLLNDFGTPTLLIIRLPLNLIDKYYLRKYINIFMNRWVSQFIFHEDADLTVKMSISTNFVIKPQYIYRHEHPKAFIENRSFYCDKCKKRIPKKM